MPVTRGEVHFLAGALEQTGALARRVGVRPAIVFILMLSVACDERPARAEATVATPTPSLEELPGARVGAPAPASSYDELLATTAAQRRQLARRLARASAAEERSAILREARAHLSAALVERLLPRWLGTPWAMDGTTTRPGEGEIACGYFVATILRDAGFVVDRVRFGQAAALRIQEATTPPGRGVHRFFSIPAETLARKIAALGDGVYLIGLNVHVGFVVVRDGDVRLVHASYTDDRVVVDEPLAGARAIELSRPKGYFVSELISADAAIVRWLEEQPLTLP